MKEELVQFALETEIHAVKHLVSNKSCPVKVVWALVSIGSLGFLLYLLATRYQHFSMYPVFIDSHIELRSMPMPSITVCNGNPIRWKKITYNDLMHMGPGYLCPQCDFDWRHAENLSSIREELLVDYGEEVVSYWEKLMSGSCGSAVNEEFDIEEFIKRAGHQLRDTITSIQMIGYNNTQNNGWDHISPQFIYDEQKSLIDHLGNCFTFNSGLLPNAPKLLNFSEEDMSDDLVTMHLNVEVDEYPKWLSPHFLVYLHSPLEPLIDARFLLDNDQKYLEVNVKSVRTYKQLPPPYGDCIETPSVDACPYSRSKCWRTCLGEKAFESVNCRPIGALGNFTLCQSYADVSLKELYKSTEEVFSREFPACRKSCPQPCLFYFHEYTINTENGRRNHSRRTDTDTHIITIPKPLHLMTEHRTERPLYPPEAFLAEIGGTMGLFLGASILSLLQILEFCTNLIVSAFKYRKIEADDETMSKESSETSVTYIQKY